jgi:SNF2 family DNA or RNA helicase
VISPRAIKDFLNRKLRDSRAAKQLTEAEVDRRLHTLRPQPWLHTRPKYLHQKITLLLAIARKRYLILLGLGLGKSWCVLAVLRYVHRQYVCGYRQTKPRAIVLVPGSANLGQWEDQCRQHVPQLIVVAVDGAGTGARMLQVKSGADVTILTYAGFLALVCSGKVVENEDGEIELDGDGNPKTKGWVLDKKKLAVFQQRFDFFVGDESTAFRTWGSLTFKACKALSWSCEYAYALTGTPHGKNPEDMWAQFYVIDKGETLGKTLGLFRAAFFRKVENYWTRFKYEFDERKTGQLNRMIRHNSVRFEDKDCLDLPPLIRIKRSVVMPEENFAYYDRLAEELRESWGLAATDSAFMRLRNIASGYLAVKGGGDSQVIRFAHNPKIEELLAVLAEIPIERKVLVFHEYKITGEIICAALKKAKISHDWLYSGTAAKIKKDIAKRLETRRVLVASSAAAYGLNLQVANYAIWVERPCDILLWKQEAKRCHRAGQTRTVRLIDIYCKNSVDERIIESHDAGESLFVNIVDGKELARKIL